jgi:tripartite-type tricarboxylate transporter receptor subunit TctC
VKALGATGKTRSAVMPDLPTVAEAGVPGYEAVIWLGIMAPKGTPNDVVAYLNKHINTVIEKPEVKAAWLKQGAIPMEKTPAEFDAFLRKDIDKWANVVKTANIKVQ